MKDWSNPSYHEWKLFSQFYLWLYGVRLMVKDHSDSEGGNMLLPPHRIAFPITARNLLYAPFHRWDIKYHIPCTVVEHWMEWEILNNFSQSFRKEMFYFVSHLPWHMDIWHHTSGSRIHRYQENRNRNRKWFI